MHPPTDLPQTETEGTVRSPAPPGTVVTFDDAPAADAEVRPNATIVGVGGEALEQQSQRYTRRSAPR